LRKENAGIPDIAPKTRNSKTILQLNEGRDYLSCLF
jgi:hypothetical protein